MIHRDELVISTKAGWDMWPGPYGDLGSASTFWRAWIRVSNAWVLTTWTSSTITIFDPDTPLEETLERSTPQCSRAKHFM